MHYSKKGSGLLVLLITVAIIGVMMWYMYLRTGTSGTGIEQTQVGIGTIKEAEKVRDSTSQYYNSLGSQNASQQY